MPIYANIMSQKIRVVRGITNRSICTVLYGSELCNWCKFGPMTMSVVTTSSLVETFGSQFLQNFEQGQTSELHWWSQPVTSLKSLGLPFHGEISQPPGKYIRDKIILKVVLLLITWQPHVAFMTLCLMIPNWLATLPAAIYPSLH